MLVLSRQRDETIMIGDEITLTIVDIRGDKVRVGIEAPANVAVHRKEVYDAIRNENQKAADFSGSVSQLPGNQSSDGPRRSANALMADAVPVRSKSPRRERA